MKTIFLNLILAIALIGCQSNTEIVEQDLASVNQLTQEQESLAGIKFGTLTKQPINKKIKCRGVIDIPPQNRASITAPLGGKLEMVKFYPGDKVTKGTILCMLTDQHFIEMQQDYLTQIVALENLKLEFERKEQLFNAEASSSKEYQLAKTNFKNAEIKLEGLKQKLIWAGFNADEIEKNGIQSSLEIRSTINGFITDVNVNLGMQVTEGAVLYELVDNSHLHLELQVYQKDLPFIEKGQTILFSIPGTEKHYQGEVYLIGQKVDEATHTVNIHGHFDEESSLLKPGTIFQAEIVVQTDTLLALPTPSIIKENGLIYAFCKEENSIKKIELEVGVSDDEYSEIKNANLLLNKQFVLEGSYYLN